MASRLSGWLKYRNVAAHIWYKCPGNHDGPCMFCDGGLSLCELCGAFEGQLLTCCPGYKLNAEALDACYNGNVKDFLMFKQWAKNGYNVRKKFWK